MIVLVLGNVASSRKMLALIRDCIATYEEPAAYIDAVEGVRFDPVAAMHLESAEMIERRLAGLARALFDDGARRLVLPVPPAHPGHPALDPARLAFWLKRAAGDPVYLLDVDRAVREKSPGTWSPDVVEATVRQLVKSLGPAQEVHPWSPEPPRYLTERLTLTWPTDAQLRGYHDAIIGTDVFSTLIWNGPTGEDDLPDYWLERRRDFARGPQHELALALIENSTRLMVGACSLRPKAVEHGIWDIGYVVAPPWQGRGYATEMTRRLVDIAFSERHAERVYANAFVGNQASRRVLEKCGFEFEGTCRSVIAKPDGRRDEWMLAVTRDKWRPN